MKKLTSLLTLILILVSAGGLNAQQTATVSVDKSSLSFSAQVGGSAPSQSLTINNAGSTNFVAFSNVSWLKLNGQVTLGGAAPATVTVTADPTGLAAGNYQTNITVYGTSGGPAVSVPVTFSVGLIGVTPSTVAFTYQMNGLTPTPVSLTLSAAGATSYTASATTTSGGNWFSVPQSGTAPGTLVVTPNLGVIGPGMAAGTYNGTITITSPSGPAATVPVTLTITPAPTVTANPTTVNLNYQLGGSTGATNTPSATLTLTNPGNQDLPYLLTPSSTPAGWLTATPATGTIPANGSVQIAVAYATSANLPASTYNGSITIYVSGAANSQVNVPVRLLVSNNPLLTVPNSTLSYTYQLGGAIPASQTVLATSSAVAASSTTGQMPLIINATTATGGNWLIVPASAVTGTNFAISVNPTGLAVGTYNGTVSVTGVGAGNGAQTIPVTLTVSNDPLIVATFGGCSTQTVTCPLNFPIQVGQNSPTSQTIAVTSSTGAQASFSATVTVTPSQSGCGTTWLSSGVTAAVVGSTASFPISVTAPGTIPTAGLTCTGTVTITGINPTTGVALPNSPVTIPVSMYVSANPMVVPSAVALNFAIPTNTSAASGSTSVPQFAVTSTSGSANLDFTVSTPSNAPWLLAGPSSRNTAAGTNTVVVAVNSAGLAPGTYTSALTITSSNALNSPVTVPVTMTVTSATMSVSPSSLSFSQTRGAAAPDAKTLQVSTNSTDIGFTVSVTTAKGSGWLSATTSTNTATQANPATVTVRVDGSNLAPDTYQGAVTITSTSPFTSNSPVTIPVTLEVKPGTISVTPASLTFNQVQGGPVPQSQTIAVASNPTNAALAYTVTTSVSGGMANWISVDTTSGTTPGNVKVTVNGAGLQPATYTGKVTITSTGATGSPIDVPVTLVVTAPQTIAVSPAAVNFSYIIGSTTAPPQQTVQLTTSTGTPFTASVSSNATWLTVSPASGTGSGPININVNPSGLAAGNYTGTISINSTAAVNNPAASITVNFNVQAVPKPVFTAVANAASYVNGPVSPGENIVIFGTGLGPASVTLGKVTGNSFDTTLAETQVLFDGVPAPIIYASAGQTSVMVPYGVAGRATTNIRLSYKGVQSDPITYTVTSAVPGIYTLNQAGNGQGAILNQDYSVNGPSSAGAKDSVVAIYMTGEGVTSPASADGAIAPTNGSGLYKPLQNVTATIGGAPAKVEYYGSAPGIIYGVMQVNVRIPADAASGNLPLVINVGSNASQPSVTVAVR